MGTHLRVLGESYTMADFKYGVVSNTHGNTNISDFIICLLLILCCDWSDHDHMTTLHN